MPKKTKRKYYRVGARGIEGGKSSIDRENHRINGLSVISVGEALGHGVEIDEITLDQVVKFGNAKPNGTKSRFGHPNMSGSAIGTHLGRMENFRRDGGRVRADLQIGNAAFDTPNGNLGDYVLNLAEEDPDAFGASIVFPRGLEEENDPDTGMKDKNGDLMPLVRMDQLNGVDIVDEPASGDGFFQKMLSTTVGLSAEMTERLAEYFKDEDALVNIELFLDRYIDNEEHKKKIKQKFKKIEIMHGFGDSQPLIPNLKTKLEVNMFRPKKGETREQFASRCSKTLLETGLVTTDADALKMCDDIYTKYSVGINSPVIMPTIAPANSITEAVVKEREEFAKAAERERIEEINTSCEELKLEKVFAVELIAKDVSIELARKQMIDKAKEKMKSALSDKVILDGSDNTRNGMVNAIMVRTGFERDAKIITDVNKSEFRGLTLQNLGKRCLMSDRMASAYMLDGQGIFEAMMENGYFSGAPTQGSGDFVNVLSGVLNKSVNMGWNTAASTFETWTGVGSLSDFKTADLVRLTEYGDVQTINEGQAPKMAKMADTKEQVRLKTVGTKYILSRQAMVNDDLSQFTTVAQRQARALKRKMNKDCYSLLYDNQGSSSAFTGPTMLEDGYQMFDATNHNNLVVAGSGAAPSQTTLDVAYIAMKNQKALTPDADRSESIYLNIGPEYILVGPKNELAVYKLLNAIGYNVSGEDGAALGTNAANIHGPGQPRALKVVIDSELDNISSARYPWWLATNPMDVGTISLYTLTGQSNPYTQSAPTPTGDARGMIWVLEHDYKFAQTDWRGMYCNAGASK